MSIRNLERIFRARSVAVVGASADPSSVGGAVLARLRAEFPGPVYAVNPRRSTVQGLRAYPSARALPAPPDLAVVCTPAAVVPDVVRDCGTAGIRGLVVVSAGFREIGEDGLRLEERVAAEARRFDGLRIVGPNCLGVIVPRIPLNASFAAATPAAGRVAFVSQSGALCTAVLDWALAEGIGFSHFVSVGNMLDVDFGDLVDYLATDPETESILLYVESIRSARKFLSAARAFTRERPIVAYKAGRFEESARAARSHTGSLAGEDAVYDAAFARAGIVRILESGGMFGCAELLARQRVPRGDRLGIVTNAGGPGVMATDALVARGGRLAPLTEATRAALDAFLPPYWSRGNPVDVLGDASAERYARAVETVLADETTDAALVVLAPQAMTDAGEVAEAVARAGRGRPKPMLASFLGRASVEEGVRRLQRAGIPNFETPEDAVAAFMDLVTYARRRETLYETPKEIPAVAPDRGVVDALLDEARRRPTDLLDEMAAKRLLAAYGIPVVPTRAARSAEEAAAVARAMGFPVALKILSPDIAHKTDVGGVALGLGSEKAVREAYERIVRAAAELRPGARIEGVTVQPMAETEGGVELILGSKKDPTFGAAILVGTGGTAAEIFRDRRVGLPPLNERLARRMLESLRSWPLLEGFRGRPAVAVDELVTTLVRFSYLVADVPAIAELDVNPLLATPRGVVALDARVVVDRAALASPPKPYAHLAIRPYPETFVRSARLADGRSVTLRPIRPEDEPLWLDLLDRCSSETLFQRFQAIFTRTHEVAARFCFIDYDREMAVVAEVEEEGRRRLVGVGRLVADPDRERAEYAVLVVDDWQGRGLGSLLTDECLRIAERWGVRRVVALTPADNRRMVRILERRGFRLERRPSEGVVFATKELSARAGVGG